MAVFEVLAENGNHGRLIRIYTGRKMAVSMNTRYSVLWKKPVLIIGGFRNVRFHELTREMITGAEISTWGDHLYIHFRLEGINQTFVLDNMFQKACCGY